MPPIVSFGGHAHNLIEKDTRLTIEGGEKNIINSYLYNPAKEKTRRRKHDVGNKLTPFKFSGNSNLIIAFYYQ